MSVDTYFVNKTKKQIVSSKQLFCNFEDKNQLLTYLSQCIGDSIIIMNGDCQFIEDYVCEISHQDYKYIHLYEFSINDERNACVDDLLNEIHNNT